MNIDVLGLHPVKEADQPCHLVEMRISNHSGTLDLSEIHVPHTRGAPGMDQVPWCPHVLNADGTNGKDLGLDDPIINEAARLAFFIFCLSESRKLQSPAGLLSLPPETPRPERLKFIKYVAPD